MTLYTEAINKYGKKMQVLKAIEEFSELIRALSRNLNERDFLPDYNLIEEIADAEIMLEQLREIYNANEAINDVKASKLLRLKKMLAN